MYFPEDIWQYILHEFLWPKNNKYWESFKSRDGLLLELTKKNIFKFDMETKKRCDDYLKHSKFYSWMIIPPCFKNRILNQKYTLLLDLQKHTHNYVYILFERIRMLKKYLKYRKNGRYKRELKQNIECIQMIFKKTNYIIRHNDFTTFDEEYQNSNSSKTDNLIENIKNTSIDIRDYFRENGHITRD